MIFMPPRHGKSELASIRFPAWFLGRHEGRSIIAASYNSELAGDFGYAVREVVRSRLYSNVFPGKGLARDSQAAGRWRTSLGGSYASAGVGTAVTGRGADVFLIDDPFKDRESADSAIVREKVYRWYTSTAYTRLEGDIAAEDLEDDSIWKGFRREIDRGDAEPFHGAIVLIQTRWHEDDLAGRLLADEANGGDQWEKLILPAIMSDGTALWPEKYPLEQLLMRKKVLSMTSPRDWSALYQQEPSPEEGTFFQRDWFGRHRMGMFGEPVHLYGCSDYAVTEGSGDYTEHGVFAVGASGRIYQADWWHGQTSSDKWIDAKLDLIDRHKPIAWFGEAGVIQKAVAPMIRRRMIERRVRCRMEWLPSIHDKPTRARGFQSRAAMGEVSLLEDDRGERLMNQLLAFPAGKHDDAVDVCGMIGRALDSAHPAMVMPKCAGETERDSYQSANEGADSWRV